MSSASSNSRLNLLWGLLLTCRLYSGAAAVINTNDGELAQRDSTNTYDNAYYVVQGSWKCDFTQLRLLDAAINEAEELAQKTIEVLQVEGAETSISFDTWFGSSM